MKGPLTTAQTGIEFAGKMEIMHNNIPDRHKPQSAQLVA